MSLPASAANVFWGVNTRLQVSGATHAAVSNIRLQWGNRIHEELVVGTDIPYVGTGGFHGEIEWESLGANDLRLEQIVAPTSGLITTFGLVWREDSTAGGASNQRDWTVSGKFSQYEKISERDNVVRYRIRGTMVARPSVTNISG